MNLPNLSPVAMQHLLQIVAEKLVELDQDREYFLSKLQMKEVQCQELEEKIKSSDELFLKAQIDELAKFILSNCEGYPNRNAGAVETAIQIIKEQKEAIELLAEAAKKREIPFPHPGNQFTEGAVMIATERLRQMKEENFYNDFLHTEDQLPKAAAAYLLPDINFRRPGAIFKRNIFWPWRPELYKPSPDDRIKELKKAGALCAAEIDRIIAENERIARVKAEGESVDVGF